MPATVWQAWVYVFDYFTYLFDMGFTLISDDQAFFNGIEIRIENVSSLSSIEQVPL